MPISTSMVAWAVPKVVDTDALEPGCLGAAGHLVVEQMLRHGRKYPRVRFGLRMLPKIFFDLLCEEGRHRNHTVGLRGLWRVYNVHAAHTPEGLRYVDLRHLEVDIGGSQREHLANAQSAPEQDLECDVRIRLIGYGIRESKVLFSRPNIHLALLLGADLSCNLHGISLEAVEAHQVVHDRRELAAKGVQVGGCVGCAAFRATPQADGSPSR